MKKPTNKEIHLQNKFNHNPLNICLHTGIPNRINTHKVPGINTGYPPHYPTQKQNKIILTLTYLTKVHNIIPIPSITNIPSTNIIIPNTYIKVPHRGFWGFRQTRQVITPLLYKATQLTI